MPRICRSLASPVAIDALEARTLFAATVVNPIPNSSGDAGGAATTIDLSSVFADEDDTFVQFHTALGDFRAVLFQQERPITVQNFLKYVTQQRLDGTLIHRSDILETTDANDQPPQILQGGGFTFPGFGQIKMDKPIVNESRSGGVISNVRGTLSMARGTDPNSATSQFFVNVTDNTSLDPGADASDPNQAGYAVFGKVLDVDLPAVDAIAALPRFGFGDVQTSPFRHLPLRNYTQNDYSAGTVPGENNVVTETVAAIPDVFSYTATSSDPTTVNPSISNGQLVLNYGATGGNAQITVTATAIDGSATQTTFTAGVGQLDITLGGDSGNKTASYVDADGTVSTISYKGAGSATVHFTGSGLLQTVRKGKVTVSGTAAVADTIAATATDGSTSISISSKGGDGVTNVGGISASGETRSISGKSVIITRGLVTGRIANSVTIAGATAATINLGGAALDKGVSLSLGALTDTGVVVTAPVRSLKLTSAADTGGATEQITAVSIASISVSGDLGENVILLGESNIGSVKVGGNLTGDLAAHQIASISVRGNVSGAVITATHDASESPDAATADSKANQAIQSVKVGGAITGTTINSAGSIGSISAGSISGSTILLGAADGVTGLPAALADLPAPATLNSLKVKGAYAGSVVAAKFLGKLSLGTLTTANGGTPFGFAADRIVSLSGKTDGGQKFSVRNADVQGDADAALTGITLADAVVRLL